jgi:hypothetical protein
MNHDPENWFKHSTDSHNEPSMRRIKSRFGKLNGYAMYYISIEIMMRSGGWIEHADLEIYTDDYGVELDVLNSFFSYCESIGVFTSDGSRYTAEIVQATMQKRKRISEIRSEAGSIGGKAKAKLGNEPEPKPKKPKSEQKPDPETQESARVRSMIADLEAEFGAQKISNLSNAEAAKIVEKYGDHAPFALRIFYLWKVSKGKRVKSDYLSLLAPWVQDEVAKERQRKNGNQSVPTRKELLEAYSQ